MISKTGYQLEEENIKDEQKMMDRSAKILLDTNGNPLPKEFQAYSNMIS